MKILKAFNNKHVLVLIISLIGTSIYFQTFGFDFTIDDRIYSFNNLATQEGLNRIRDLFQYGSLSFNDSQYATNSGTYRPVTLLTFALEHHIFGEFKPAVGHILNVVLYLLVNIVLGFCFLLLFQRKTNNYFIPLMILLLWSLHPLHVEVVASIKSRDTLLSAFFSFSAILLWIRQMNKNTARTTRGTSGKMSEKTTHWWQKYLNPVLIGFIFLLGLLSKEESLPLIAVAVLSGYYFFNLTIADSIKKAIPFILAGIVYLGARSLILDPSPDAFNSILNSVIFGADGSNRMATNLYIYLYYIRLLFYPHPLSWDYSFSQVPIKSMGDPWVLFSFTFFILLMLYALYSMKNRNMIGFGILFYFTTFSIFSNISESIAIGATIGERFMFIPSAGFAIVVVCGLFSIVQRFNVRRQNLIGLLILSPVLIFFSIKSYSYTQAWQNNLKIKEHGAKAAPKSWRTQISYGDELRKQANALRNLYRDDQSKTDSVQKLYAIALRYYEAGFYVIQNRPEKPALHYMGLGECYLNIGDTASAVQAYQTQVRLTPDTYHPKFVLGVISYNKRAYVEAISYFEQARQANAPDLFSIYRYLGLTHMRMGNNDQAIEAFETALNHGTNQSLVNNLKTLYANTGAFDKLSELIASEPGLSEAERKLLPILAEGRAAYNRQEFQIVTTLFEQFDLNVEESIGLPEFREFINIWSNSYINLGRIDLARQLFQRILRYDQDNYFALLNLGNIAFHREKGYQKAIEYYLLCINSEEADRFTLYSLIGGSYYFQNNLDKAIENYEKAMEHGSSNEVINILMTMWRLKGDMNKVAHYQGLISNN